MRAKELHILRSVRYLGGAQGFFWSAMPAFMVRATFAARPHRDRSRHNTMRPP